MEQSQSIRRIRERETYTNLIECFRRVGKRTCSAARHSALYCPAHHGQMALWQLAKVRTLVNGRSDEIVLLADLYDRFDLLRGVV